MIEYAKQILPKVCHWKTLFRKELIKSIEWAGTENCDELFNWCYKAYGNIHMDILEEVFQDRIKKKFPLDENYKSRNAATDEFEKRKDYKYRKKTFTTVNLEKVNEENVSDENTDCF